MGSDDDGDSGRCLNASSDEAGTSTSAVAFAITIVKCFFHFEFSLTEWYFILGTIENLVLQPIFSKDLVLPDEAQDNRESVVKWFFFPK